MHANAGQEQAERGECRVGEQIAVAQRQACTVRVRVTLREEAGECVPGPAQHREQRFHAALLETQIEGGAQRLRTQIGSARLHVVGQVVVDARELTTGGAGAVVLAARREKRERDALVATHRHRRGLTAVRGATADVRSQCVHLARAHQHRAVEPDRVVRAVRALVATLADHERLTARRGLAGDQAQLAHRVLTGATPQRHTRDVHILADAERDRIGRAAVAPAAAAACEACHVSRLHRGTRCGGRQRVAAASRAACRGGCILGCVLGAVARLFARQR
mmetsp:Transcript_13852/g.41726  ORF Transcript_13852/g.41726 Transcript_13852/m.41726 type:complete len:278 (+) Transcript_13852:496-1329(+)